MKLLIVDDSREKVGKIVRRLTDAGRIRRENIEVSYNAEDARSKLSEERYDLLLLDVVLPLRDEDEEAAATSVDLLVELTEASTLLKPRHILGVTAFQEAMDEVSQVFRDRTWNIVHASETGEDWLQQISNFVEYVAAECAQEQQPTSIVDLAIFTALRSPEMRALRQIDWSWGPETPIDDVSFASFGKFQSQGREFSVISAFAPRMGMVPTAVLVSKIIGKYRPKVCVMAGICAGVRGATNIGDIIFSSLCWDYQSGKHFVTEKKVAGFQLEPYQVRADPLLVSRADQLAQDHSFWQSVVSSWPQDRSPPRLLTGPTASGAAVLADSNVTKRIVEQQRKLLGIDMELYGLFSAADGAASPRPMAMGLKSVCDYADESKSDADQAFAAYTSAEACRGYFERYGRDLLE